ncbi:MAG: GDP-L-fucose synthase [Verrucomicrobiae bacterium]|nr:GDP-L-fucose synthase [Verrucomicrobiae bacterium]
MNASSRICVLGAETLLGAALVRALARRGICDVVRELASGVECVFVADGRSGGILANQKYPADLCLDNLLVATRVIPEAYRLGVKNLLYLGSSCIYPKHAPQPMAVESLMSGPLEPTSEPYALAKLAGLKLCEAWRRQYGVRFMAAIPADVYGPGGKFDPEDSHVIPSLMARMHNAKERGFDHLTLWGTGNPRREFIHADDLADACLHVMEKHDGDAPMNLGSGEATSIRELAETLREVVGFSGELRWDLARPDGAPVKWLDTAPLRALSWRPSIGLKEGLFATYRHFLDLKQAAKASTCNS